MAYHLFLDDERNISNVTWCELPSKITNNWVTVRNFNEFVRTVLSFGVPDFVSFDHDLADEHYVAMLKDVELNRNGLINTVDYGPEKTGYDCCKWLVDFCEERNLKFPPFQVHSMNPIGRERIINYVENAKKYLSI